VPIRRGERRSEFQHCKTGDRLLIEYLLSSILRHKQEACASVVGLLGAALYDPVWTSAVRGPLDVAIAVIGFMLLVAWRVSALLVVSWCVAASVAGAMLL
jgi:hypothetical protein